MIYIYIKKNNNKALRQIPRGVSVNETQLIYQKDSSVCGRTKAGVRRCICRLHEDAGRRRRQGSEERKPHQPLHCGMRALSYSRPHQRESGCQCLFYLAEVKHLAATLGGQPSDARTASTPVFIMGPLLHITDY